MGVILKFLLPHVGRRVYRHCLAIPILLIGCGLTGCVDMGAPSFTMFGAYVPYWMVCTTIALFLTILARVIFIHLGIDDALPVRLLAYLCLMLTLSFLLSWLFFL